MSIKVSIENQTNLHIEKVGSEVELKQGSNLVQSFPVSVFDSGLFSTRNSYPVVIKDGELHVVRYVPLHGHSGYSMLDGASHIGDMVSKAETAMALTDHGNMFGSLEFYKSMKKAGKNPIIGCEVYSETIIGKKTRNHLVVLAETTQGYKNLVKLVSRAYENIYFKPHIKWEWLEELSEGLIVTSACLGSEIDQALIQKDISLAKQIIERFLSIFDRDHFYLEIQRHGIDEESWVNPELIKLAKEYDLKMVATADSHYTEKEDRDVQELLLCISTRTTMSDPKRMKFDGNGYHIHSSYEMVELFKDMPEVLDNTLDIAERCKVEIELGKFHMPKFDIPVEFKDDESYFKYLVEAGFKERFEGTPQFVSSEYRERLDYEVGVISKMGFPAYFLIMWDVINFAKTNGILVGPGRGSACGSLVAYALKITEVDPIKYDLLFERFLNEDRYSMPDIDTDFEDARREEVINYCREKYGQKCVSRIMTVNRLTAKSVLKDVCRVLDYPLSLGVKLANAVPNEPKMTLTKALDESPDFAHMYQNSDDCKTVINYALRLENTPKTTGIHACGVMISSDEIDNFIPTFITKDRTNENVNVYATQYDKDQNEECGLLKMDFLGLRTMGVVSNCLKDVNKKRAGLNQEPFTFGSIPKTDMATYRNIAKGNTAGVFQLEQPGMTKFMADLFQDADTMSDDSGDELYERLFAGISLYRPGPMDEIPNYINGMTHPKKIKYDLPELEPILKNTYGTIVYQEQCMRVVRDLAGFSRGQSDIIRKGMAKKKDDILNEYGPAFIYGSPEKNIEGAIPRGMDEKAVKELWDKMIKFSKYAFNKSHAVGYAFVAAGTGYLATHYPTEYLTATMNSFIKNQAKVQSYISTAKKQGLTILPPDVNFSQTKFSVAGDNEIRFGLEGVRSLGAMSEKIIEERNANGNFKSITNFVNRMIKSSKLGLSHVKALAYSGALDTFSGTRKGKVEIAEELINMGKFFATQNKDGKGSLMNCSFFADEPIFNFTGKMSKEEYDGDTMLELEKEYAGFFITGHPLDKYPSLNKDALFRNVDEMENELEEIMEQKGLDVYQPKKAYSVAGVVLETPKLAYSKNLKPFLSFVIEDTTGPIPILLFGIDALEKQDIVVKGNLLYVTGMVKAERNRVSMFVNTIDEVKNRTFQTLQTDFTLHCNYQNELVEDVKDKVLKYINSLPAPETDKKARVILKSGNETYIFPKFVSSDNPVIQRELKVLSGCKSLL